MTKQARSTRTTLLIIFLLLNHRSLSKVGKYEECNRRIRTSTNVLEKLMKL